MRIEARAIKAAAPVGKDVAKGHGLPVTAIENFKGNMGLQYEYTSLSLKGRHRTSFDLYKGICIKMKAALAKADSAHARGEVLDEVGIIAKLLGSLFAMTDQYTYGMIAEPADERIGDDLAAASRRIAKYLRQHHHEKHLATLADWAESVKNKGGIFSRNADDLSPAQNNALTAMSSAFR
ncbi:hypothetical protein ACFL1B_01970 [Nanoarchaeota archaeon]